MDTSQHGSEEFDTEGAMFQEKESLDKKEKKTRNTAAFLRTNALFWYG